MTSARVWEYYAEQWLRDIDRLDSYPDGINPFEALELDRAVAAIAESARSILRVVHDMRTDEEDRT